METLIVLRKFACDIHQERGNGKNIKRTFRSSEAYKAWWSEVALGNLLDIMAYGVGALLEKNFSWSVARIAGNMVSLMQKISISWSSSLKISEAFWFGASFGISSVGSEFSKAIGSAS